MTIRAYLRASTDKQDANRAEKSLKDFVKSFGKKIDVFYRENESGTKLDRPQLNQLLDDCDTDSKGNGDILLVEDIDRLTRLKPQEWEILDGRIKSKGIKLVIMSLPLSHEPLKDNADNTNDDITKAVMRGMGDMMVQVLATIARNDYDKRRYRQRQGIDKVLSSKDRQTKYKGKQANTKQYERILKMIDSNHTYQDIMDTLTVSSATIARAKKWRNSQSTTPDNEPLLIDPKITPTVTRKGRKPVL